MFKVPMNTKVFVYVSVVLSKDDHVFINMIQLQTQDHWDHFPAMKPRRPRFDRYKEKMIPSRFYLILKRMMTK